MRLEVDPDVKAAAGYMQDNFATDRLVPLCEELARLAPALWGRFNRAEVRGVSLVQESITSALRTPEASI